MSGKLDIIGRRSIYFQELVVDSCGIRSEMRLRRTKWPDSMLWRVRPSDKCGCGVYRRMHSPESATEECSYLLLDCLCGIGLAGKTLRSSNPRWTATLFPLVKGIAVHLLTFVPAQRACGIPVDLRGAVMHDFA